jgi:hypothetical protein
VPAAQAAQASRSTKADDILAVDVAVAFSSRTIRFVPAAGGRAGIVTVDVHATDRERVAGLEGDLCNTVIRFV